MMQPGGYMKLRWDRFFQQAQCDVKLWVFFMLLFSAERVFFLFFFRDRLAGSGSPGDYFRVLFAGARFDGMASAYIALVPFLLSAVCGFFDWERTAARFRVAYAGIILGITVFLLGIDMGFFREFNERINSFIFQFFLDDTKALVVTIWQDYHPLLYFSAMGITGFLGFMILQRFLRHAWLPAPSFRRRSVLFAARTLITLSILAGLVISARGTLGGRPFHRKSLAVTGDEFLNKSVLNIYSALRYAVIEFVTLTRSDRGLERFLPDRDVVRAAQFAFGTNAHHTDLDDFYRREAGDPAPNPPRHIFLILGESYDSWPLLDRYRSLGLMENLREFARNGIYFPYFLPASDLTILSLATIMTGLPDSGIFINSHFQARAPFAGSIAVTFNRLGYRTRFFYGGYPTWQRVSEFARAQGFTEVYDAESMAASRTKNPWGVDDRELFDLVIKKVEDTPPSLNVILTTNNHPPFPINVWAKGFRLFRIPPGLVSKRDRVIDRKILGHIWYTDQCVGYFVREMEHRVPLPLFVITGDHYGRNFLTSRPDLFEESAVPLVLYGGDVVRELTRPEIPVGCHLDIMPTLVEMVAPKGFVYYSMGRNLLAPGGEVVGIGKDRIITAGFLIDPRNPSRYWRLPLPSAPESPGDIGRLKRLYDALNGIAWWRVNYGPGTAREHSRLSRKK
jgi:phosphoglycerol transferase MdoB-like AlkP superfamily enzyme